MNNTTTFTGTETVTQGVNGHRITRRIVGYVTLTEDTDIRMAQSYAGAVDIIRVPAGKYPIVHTQSYAGAWLAVAYDGVHTFSSWLSSVGYKESTPMECTTYLEQLQAYEIKGRTDIEMDPGFDYRAL